MAGTLASSAIVETGLGGRRRWMQRGGHPQECVSTQGQRFHRRQEACKAPARHTALQLQHALPAHVPLVGTGLHYDNLARARAGGAVQQPDYSLVMKCGQFQQRVCQTLAAFILEGEVRVSNPLPAQLGTLVSRIRSPKGCRMEGCSISDKA